MKSAVILLATVLVFLGLGSSARAQDLLNGEYIGVDEAKGARIQISPDPGGFSGTFYDPNGRSQSFKADKVEDAAEAVLDMDGRTVLLRIAPLPIGAQVSLIPFRSDGNLDLEYARSLGFVRKGVALPTPPQDFLPPPRSDCRRVAAYGFLSSYAFWQPTGVVNGYTCLPDRHRVIIKMFPAVQLDIIWKLCLAPNADRALAIALRGQGVTCDQVRAGIANSQRTGKFSAYKAEVERELDTLITTIRCADGYRESQATCTASSQRLAQAAVDMRTAGMVLGRYR